jgi:hypothetical protein
MSDDNEDKIRADEGEDDVEDDDDGEGDAITAVKLERFKFNWEDDMQRRIAKWITANDEFLYVESGVFTRLLLSISN